MASELPYFKFFPLKWLMGSISDQDFKIQGQFVHVSCIYWSKNCDITKDKLEQKVHKTIVKALIDRELIKIEDGRVIISFLDEQWHELSDIQQKRSKAGLASVKSRVQTKEIHKDKKREDKKREDTYRSFAHLSISNEEFNKIVQEGYSKDQVDMILDSIENYKKNTNYKSLYLTALKWISKEPKIIQKSSNTTEILPLD